jgi:hypothetical protein
VIVAGRDVHHDRYTRPLPCLLLLLLLPLLLLLVVVVVVVVCAARVRSGRPSPTSAACCSPQKAVSMWQT